MKTSHTQLLSLILLALACLGTTAEVYKWTDETGRVHYSDKPDGEDLVVMNVKSKRTDKAALAQVRQEKLDAAQAAAADLQAQEALAEEEMQNAAIREENCRRATEAVTSMKNAQRLYVPSEGGERRYLSDDEIAERIQRAETDQSRWCSKV